MEVVNQTYKISEVGQRARLKRKNKTSGRVKKTNVQVANHPCSLFWCFKSTACASSCTKSMQHNLCWSLALKRPNIKKILLHSDLPQCCSLLSELPSNSIWWLGCYCFSCLWPAVATFAFSSTFAVKKFASNALRHAHHDA